MSLPNFTDDELRCKGSGLLVLAPGFGQALQGLRDALTLALELTGVSPTMVINSACRSLAHNRAEGGHPRSLHVCDFPYWPTGGTCAVDVATPADNAVLYRDVLTEVAWARGWSIGFHPAFLHLDLRTVYAGRPQATFTY